MEHADEGFTVGTDTAGSQPTERVGAGPQGKWRGETETEEGRLACSPLAMSCPLQ